MIYKVYKYKFKSKKIRTLNIGVGYIDKKGDVRIDVKKTPNVNCLGDARSLPFKSNSFEFICCEHVLEHLQEDPAYGVYDQTKALKEIYRVLNHNGKVLFKFPNGWMAIAYDHKRCWNARTWEILLKKNGFEVIWKRGTGTFVYDGLNRFLNFILKYFSQHPWFIGLNSEFTFLVKRI